MLKRTSLIKRNGKSAKRSGKISDLGLSTEETVYLQKAKSDDAWLNNRPAAFWGKYARQYVAVRNQKVIAHSKSMRVLRRQLSKRKIRFVTISLIEDPSEVVIYAL